MPGSSSWMPFAPQGLKGFDDDDDDDDGDDGDYVYSTKPNLTPACLSLVGRALDVPALPPWVKPKQQVYPERR